MSADNRTEGIWKQGLVSPELLYLISVSSAPVIVVLTCLGVMSNIVNIRTFTAMGLSDGVTISFLALSIIDLTFLISSLMVEISFFFVIAEMASRVRFAIDPFAVCVFASNIVNIFSLTNVLATTFLAVVRCISVAKPIFYRNHYTRRLTINAMVSFLIFAVGIYTPIWANMGMITVTDKQTNVTRRRLWLTSERETVKDVIHLMVNNILTLPTEVIILFCLFDMIRRLRNMSRFRQSFKMALVNTNRQECEISNSVEENQKTSSDTPTTDSDKLSGKDLRVVQQVVLISVVYIVCYTPRMLVSSAGVIVPAFSIDAQYRNLYLCIVCILPYLHISNASMNTFIYYKYNVKFQTMLLHLIRRQP